MSQSRVDILLMSKLNFNLGTVEENSSIIGPPTEIGPTHVGCWCNALTPKL